MRIVLGQFVIEPITGFFWPPPSAPELANEIAGNAKMALLALLLVWTFAAFGEEIAYRGYLQPTSGKDRQQLTGLES